jgi:hypothetical protein
VASQSFLHPSDRWMTMQGHHCMTPPDTPATAAPCGQNTESGVVQRNEQKSCVVVHTSEHTAGWLPDPVEHNYHHHHHQPFSPLAVCHPSHPSHPSHPPPLPPRPSPPASQGITYGDCYMSPLQEVQRHASEASVSHRSRLDVTGSDRVDLGTDGQPAAAAGGGGGGGAAHVPLRAPTSPGHDQPQTRTPNAPRAMQRSNVRPRAMQRSNVRPCAMQRSSVRTQDTSVGEMGVGTAAWPGAPDGTVIVCGTLSIDARLVDQPPTTTTTTTPPAETDERQPTARRFVRENACHPAARAPTTSHNQSTTVDDSTTPTSQQEEGQRERSQRTGGEAHERTIIRFQGVCRVLSIVLTAASRRPRDTPNAWVEATTDQTATIGYDPRKTAAIHYTAALVLSSSPPSSSSFSSTEINGTPYPPYPPYRAPQTAGQPPTVRQHDQQSHPMRRGRQRQSVDDNGSVRRSAGGDGRRVGVSKKGDSPSVEKASSASSRRSSLHPQEHHLPNQTPDRQLEGHQLGTAADANEPRNGSPSASLGRPCPKHGKKPKSKSK